eukprot:6179419-Pleurochrysis_carterae.AAC.1
MAAGFGMVPSALTRERASPRRPRARRSPHRLQELAPRRDPRSPRNLHYRLVEKYLLPSPSTRPLQPQSCQRRRFWPLKQSSRQSPPPQSRPLLAGCCHQWARMLGLAPAASPRVPPAVIGAVKALAAGNDVEEDVPPLFRLLDEPPSPLAARLRRAANDRRFMTIRVPELFGQKYREKNGAHAAQQTMVSGHC